MGARFYDPSIGRWLSEDPAQSFEPGSLNFYAYVRNNPLILLDPNGMMPIKCDGECSTSTQETVVGWVNEHGEQGALERVQQAWRTLDRILEALNAAGISASGLSFADIIRAINEAGPSSSSKPTDAQIRLQYYRGMALFHSGVVVGLAGAYVATFNPPLGVATMAVGVRLMTSGGYAIIVALEDDRKYYGGRVFESLDPYTRGFIGFFFGAP